VQHALLRVRVGVRTGRKRVNRAAESVWVRARAQGRKAFLVFWTFFCFGLFALSIPLGILSEKPVRAFRRRMHVLWGGGLLWAFGARVTITGTPPTGAFFLVSNHLSYIDIFLLARTASPVFVGMSDLARWPVFGYMMRKTYQIFICREDMRDAQRVLGLIHDALDNGEGVAVFPEAGCTRGINVRAFRPALLQAPALRQMPVHCATITYATGPRQPAAGDSVVWWRWEPVGDHLDRLLKLDHFDATIHFSPLPITGVDRKDLARKTHATVSRYYQPVRQGVLPELPPPPGAKLFE